MQTFIIKKFHNTNFIQFDCKTNAVFSAKNECQFLKNPYYGNGFTLVELLVVLALAALSATIVGGSAHAFMERSHYHKAVRDVATQLGRARMLCVQEGRNVIVSYDPQTRQLTIDGNSPLTIDASADVAWQTRRPEDRMQQGPQPVFVFQANGGAVGGHLTVARANGNGVTFQVNWLLGMVEQTTAAPQV